MKDLKTTSLILAAILISALVVNYFVSMRIYGQWQFRDFYTNPYYWIFLGSAIFFKILITVLCKRFKKSDTGKKS